MRRIRIEGRGGMAEEGKWKRTRNERGGGEEEEEEEEEEDMSARAETFNNINRKCTRELRHSSVVEMTSLVSIANERTS